MSIRRRSCASSGGSSAIWRSADARRNRCAINMNTDVRPSSVAYVRPSAANADLIVDGTGALDWKVERVMTEMRKRGLLARCGCSELSNRAKGLPASHRKYPKVVLAFEEVFLHALRAAHCGEHTRLPQDIALSQEQTCPGG